MIFIYDLLNITEGILTIAVKWYLMIFLYRVIKERRWPKQWL